MIKKTFMLMLASFASTRRAFDVIRGSNKRLVSVAVDVSHLGSKEM